jgi:hypothetical protein
VNIFDILPILHHIISTAYNILYPLIFYKSHFMIVKKVVKLSIKPDLPQQKPEQAPAERQQEGNRKEDTFRQIPCASKFEAQRKVH